MIFDCSIFHEEFDMLEFRLRELSDTVDFFVIAEANRTFSNQSKPLHLKELPDRYAKYADRIIYVPVTDMPHGTNAWVREIHQRNAVLRGLQRAKPNDLVIMSDIDEIPNVKVVESQISDDDICSLKQNFFYYYFNLRLGHWDLSSASLFKNIVITPHECRDLPGRPQILNAGWHFSYLMPAPHIAQKIAAFSHQELNLPEYVDVEGIKASIAGHRDLFGRSIDMQIVAVDETFPNELIRFPDRYAEFLLSP